MTPSPEELSVEEFRALRATIRERGSLRLFVAPITFVAWAGVALVVAAWLSTPLFALLPLIVLAGGFESVLSLHIGVERVGRFLQVFYESDHETRPGWEHAAMTASPATKPSLLIDPLFSPVFLAATLVNLLLALFTLAGPAGLPSAFWAELALASFAHALLVMRVISGRRFAAGQRARDLAMYQEYARQRGSQRSN